MQTQTQIEPLQPAALHATVAVKPAPPALETSPELLAAALALLDCWAAGILAAAPMAPSFQRYEIDREFRVDRQILAGTGGSACGVVALTAVACILRGIATGALIVTNDTAVKHVDATLAGIAVELDRAQALLGPLATSWFDEPPGLPAAG